MVEMLETFSHSAEKGARRLEGKKANWVYYVRWVNPSFTEAVREHRGWRRGRGSVRTEGE